MLGFLSLRNYKVWRSFDRALWTPSKHIPSMATLKVSPLRMIRVFGPPDKTQIIEGVSGVFDFEDDNFDYFRVHEIRETRETSPEAQQRRRHPPMNLRNKKMPLPVIEEFWNSSEEVNFRVTSSEHADIKSFMSWAREMIEANRDIKKIVIEKFGPIQGVNEYGKTYPIESEFAFFKYNSSMWPTVTKGKKEVAKPKAGKTAKDSLEEKEDKKEKAAAPKQPQVKSEAPKSAEVQNDKTAAKAEAKPESKPESLKTEN